MVYPCLLAAEDNDIFLARYAEDSIYFDGMVTDWEDAGYPSLELADGSVVVGKEGWENGDDMSLKLYFAYDEQSLFIAVKAKDNKHVRTKTFESDEDHLEFWIKTPSPDGEDVRVIAYYPGRKFPTYKGGVRWFDPAKGKSKPVKGVKFFEKTEKKGWEAEIVIPWKSMPGVYKKLPATLWAVAMVDCDNFHVRTRESVLATGWSGDKPRMKLVTIEDVENIAEVFMKQVGFKAESSTRLYADVAMDGRVEVILQADTVFAVFGHGFKDGEGYVYIDIPVEKVKHIEYFTLMDATGNGKKDFVFKYKQYGKNWRRRMFAVYGFRGEEAGRIFAQDTERKVGDKVAASKVEILEGAMKGKSLIKVTAGEVNGWTKDNFDLQTEVDVEGVILPWEEETTKYYIYRDGGFEKEDTAAVEKYLAKPKKKKKKGKKKKKKKKISAGAQACYLTFIPNTSLPSVPSSQSVKQLQL